MLEHQRNTIPESQRLKLQFCFAHLLELYHYNEKKPVLDY